MSVTVINKMKNVIRDITKLLVTYFVPVIIITMFICFCMDMPGTTAAIVGSLMGYFFICFDGGKARKAIWRATSTFSKVYSFFDSDRTNVYHEDLTPLHHVTVSTPALFHIGIYIVYSRLLNFVYKCFQQADDQQEVGRHFRFHPCTVSQLL